MYVMYVCIQIHIYKDKRRVAEEACKLQLTLRPTHAIPTIILLFSLDKYLFSNVTRIYGAQYSNVHKAYGYILLYTS